MNAAYTLAGSDSNAPDSGNSTIGVVQYDPYDIEKDRGPDPNVVKHRVVMNSTWDIPVGRDRPFGSDMPRWADAIVGGWTVSTIFQARSGPNLTPFFTYGTDPIYPANTGRSARRRRTVRRSVAARRHRGSEHRRDRATVLRPDRVHAAGAGHARQRQEGQRQGTGHVDRQLRVLQGHRPDDGLTAEFTALLDNAFNHPQFFVGSARPGSWT